MPEFFYVISRGSGKGIANTSTIAILWIHSPVASKLGLRPQTVSPQRLISSHKISQSFPTVCLCLFPNLYLHKKSSGNSRSFSWKHYLPVFNSVQYLSYMVMAFPISCSHSPLSLWALAFFRIGFSTISFFCMGIALALALGTRM